MIKLLEFNYYLIIYCVFYLIILFVLLIFIIIILWGSSIFHLIIFQFFLNIKLIAFFDCNLFNSEFHIYLIRKKSLYLLVVITGIYFYSKNGRIHVRLWGEYGQNI